MNNDIAIDPKVYHNIKLAHPKSVSKGEIPFIEFHDEQGKSLGKLWGKDGKLSFEGDVDESARIFFEEVIKRNKHLLEE